MTTDNKPNSEPADAWGSLVPQPAVVRAGDGTLHLDGGTAIVAADDALGPALLLHDYLRAGTGLPVPVVPSAPEGATPVVLRVLADHQGGAEGYTLAITADGVALDAAAPAGLARGVQTLRQLLPAATLRRVPIVAGPVTLPLGEIEDAPRFGWRGVMLDVARHFQPKDFVLRFIDLAALHRLNVVHLHLTEDQGWRFEVPGWPKLTEISSWRKETGRGRGPDWVGDGTPHGGFYTVDDLREIVAFAAARHVTVVPEFNLPGHSQAAIAAYPELGTTSPHEVLTSWGISDHVMLPTDEVVRFAKDVLDTICDIFPSEYVHIGGDECPRTEWRASAAAAARAAELGLSSVDELQSWLGRQLVSYLAGKGRRAVGWDEVLEDGGVPRDTVVMAWRAPDRATDALKSGHDTVVAITEYSYLDYYQSESPEEPLGIFKLIPLEKIAGYEPIGGLPDATGTVLGVQAQLWSEYLPDAAAVEYMAYPRLSAFAEVGWTVPERRDADDLLRRIGGHLARLDAIGVNYRPLAGPKPWQKGGTGLRKRVEWGG